MCFIFFHSTFPWSTTSSWRLRKSGKMKYTDVPCRPRSHTEDTGSWELGATAHGSCQESQLIFTWHSGGRGRQICKFKARLVYIVNSRKAVAMKRGQCWDPVSKNPVCVCVCVCMITWTGYLHRWVKNRVLWINEGCGLKASFQIHMLRSKSPL